MANADDIIMYAGQYENLDDALADFEAIKILKHEKFIGDYESAVFTKEEGGDVKVIDTDATERAFGAKVGLVTGAVLGILFPPSLLGMAAVGAGTGALIGNLMKGIKRSDIKEMGEMLDEGEAGVVLIGFATIEEGEERLMKKASKIIKKQVDADAEEIKRSIDEAV